MERIKVHTGAREFFLGVNPDVTRFLDEEAAKEMRALAKARGDVHRSHGNRHFSDDAELIGCVGEWVYGAIYNMEMDYSITVKGDGRIDFRTVIGGVDVKCAVKSYRLLREVEKEHAPILVQAQFYMEPLGATLQGWEYDRVVSDSLPMQFDKKAGKDALWNHWVLVSQLQPMSSHAEALRAKGHEF
jgi:hypothetical protein